MPEKKMTVWTQQERDIFYQDQKVYPGDHNCNADRQGWIKEMYQVWKPASILDVACRDGFVTRCFFPESEIVGIDINPESIDISNREAAKFPGARYSYSVQNIMTYATDRKFDLVWCSEFIEHIPQEDAASILSKITSWSKKTVAITTPTKDGIYGDRDTNEGHINCYSQEQLNDEILKNTGKIPVFCNRDPNFLFAYWEV